MKDSVIRIKMDGLDEDEDDELPDGIEGSLTLIDEDEDDEDEEEDDYTEEDDTI